jgi:tetratricopeptide (TPR) repeat protein
MSRKLAPLLCALLLSLSAPAGSAPADAESAFAQGAELFRAEDYAAAIQYFRQARDAGLPGPAVHYNIGVCAYRLGEYAEASAAFEAVTTYYEMAPLAYYNLGLVELERGRSGAAQQWFQRARVTTDDPQLQAMADRMLRPASGASLPSRWYGILLAEAGYDDNVRLLNDDVPLPGESLDRRPGE